MDQEYYFSAQLLNVWTQLYLLLDLSDLSFQYLFLSEMFLFFPAEDDGISVEYAYSFLTLPNYFDFITAHSSLF